MLIYYLISFIIVLLPLYLALLIGPKPNSARLIYMSTGLVFASLVGLFLYLTSIDEKFSNPDSLLASIIRVSLAGLSEELVRYPAIIIAQYLGKRYTGKNKKFEGEIKFQWTDIGDPHGIGIYFGVGWGFAETIGFYIRPLYLDASNDIEWNFALHFVQILYRITAVMAHVALTYIALVITANRSFYRLTIGLHIGVNIVNEVFAVMSPHDDVLLDPTVILVALFSRFSLVLFAYFILRPKVRYFSPAVIIFLQVVMFLGFVLIGTFIYLLVWIFNMKELLEDLI